MGKHGKHGNLDGHELLHEHGVLEVQLVRVQQGRGPSGLHMHRLQLQQGGPHRAALAPQLA